MDQPIQETWRHVQSQTAALRAQIGTVIVGQTTIVDLMLTALLCRGHCLIVGVPGLAKTLLVSTLGRLLGLTFRRIQFTPDLMPMDILGSEILQGGLVGCGGGGGDWTPSVRVCAGADFRPFDPGG